jgi:RNA methyltransferase, TrmH family
MRPGNKTVKIRGRRVAGPKRIRPLPGERGRMSKQAGTASRTDARKLVRVAGLPAVLALFSAAPGRVQRLFFDERMRPHVGMLCAELARMHKPYRLVGADELERIAGSILHGGVVALALPQPLPVLDPAKAAKWALDGRLLLLLDGVGNPHNLGAIARTAAFFGVPRIVISDHPAQARPSDASYRVAEGGLEYVELYRGFHFARMLQDLRGLYHVVAATAEKGKLVAALRPSERPFALVLGNEEYGLPPATLDACDDIITLPGSGLVQSLNVAATAAILLHALTR